MLLALLTAAALAGAEPTDAAPAADAPSGVTTVAPATAVAPQKEDKRSKVVCVRERPTGSNRTQKVCYDRAAAEASRDAFRDRHVRESPNINAGASAAR